MRCLITFLVLTTIFANNLATAQFSIGFNVGYVNSLLVPTDPFAPEKDWQNPSNSSELGFYDGATGIATNFYLTWEASNRVSLGLMFRNTRFSNNATKRTSNDRNLGVAFKVNFVPHQKKVVPFAQLNIIFLGDHRLKQETLTDSRNQVQPAFEEDVRLKVALGLDLGLEFRISNGLYATATGGVHAADLREKSGAFIEPLYISQVNNPNNAPDKIIGPGYLQLAGGIKYYLSKRKKKRDF